MLDWDHIDRLRTDVGRREFSEIVSLFVGEVEEVFDRITKEGVTDHDLHFLKGSAANLGFVDFAKTCQIAQHELHVGNSPDIVQVMKCFQTSKAHFENRLAQRAG